jgi:8-oxo-dGTP diphosphatase
MGLSPYIRELRVKIGNDLILLPSVGAIILDEQRRVLLQRASDDGKWYTIGGGLEPGEQPADAVVREVMEETGLRVQPLRILAVQSSPLIVYPNGHQVQYIGTTFLCRVTGGHLHVADEESLEFRYFAADELPELRADHLLRVKLAMSEETVAFFEPAVKTGTTST